MVNSKLPNPCCQTLEKIVDDNPEISKMNQQQLQIFRDVFLSWLALFQKQIQECEFCWPFFRDVIYPNLSKVPYHRTIIMQRKGRKGLRIEIIIGDLGTRYCISCSSKRQDFVSKGLFLSLNKTKMCLLCAFVKIKSLADKINEQAEVRDEKGIIQDKKKLSEELMEELMLHWWNRKK
jgi:hypothetical protein